VVAGSIYPETPSEHIAYLRSCLTSSYKTRNIIFEHFCYCKTDQVIYHCQMRCRASRLPGFLIGALFPLEIDDGDGDGYRERQRVSCWTLETFAITSSPPLSSRSSEDSASVSYQATSLSMRVGTMFTLKQ
jgi:hypothetical protein